MSRALIVLVVIAGALAGHTTALEACGDKFLMVGRGAKFQRAYASVYPGKVVIFARPSTAPKAAIRDPQLQKAMRQAGHAVSVIEDWALLEQALKTVPIDVVLVDAVEAGRLEQAMAAAPTRPSALYVAFSSDVPKDVVCRLKSTDKPLKYLDELEGAMKTRKAPKRES